MFTIRIFREHCPRTQHYWNHGKRAKMTTAPRLQDVDISLVAAWKAITLEGSVNVNSARKDSDSNHFRQKMDISELLNILLNSIKLNS